jgi:hypothetical protein
MPVIKLQVEMAHAFLRSALALTSVASAFAQWPSYPTANVPKSADGKPNMNAPAPNTADGHTDFSGLWEYSRIGLPGGGPGGRASGASARDAAPAQAPPPLLPANTGPGLGPPTPGRLSQFFNIGSTLPDGLPMNDAAKALRKARSSENNKDNPDAHCLPLGLVQLHNHSQPRKIIQTPSLMVILYEAQAGVRQIFMDGRPLPPKDVQPWWYGYSIGHWDGETLVVETTGFRDDVWLDVEGSPLSNTGKMTERMRRLNYGSMETEITVEDAKYYTKPWTVKISHRLMLDTDLIEFICGENEKDAPHLVAR